MNHEPNPSLYVPLDCAMSVLNELAANILKLEIVIQRLDFQLFKNEKT